MTNGRRKAVRGIVWTLSKLTTLDDGTPSAVESSSSETRPRRVRVKAATTTGALIRMSIASQVGVLWLTRVAGLNPATSLVILEWDRLGASDWQARSRLLEVCRRELETRNEEPYEKADAYGELQTC